MKEEEELGSCAVAAPSRCSKEEEEEEWANIVVHFGRPNLTAAKLKLYEMHF